MLRLFGLLADAAVPLVLIVEILLPLLREKKMFPITRCAYSICKFIISKPAYLVMSEERLARAKERLVAAEKDRIAAELEAKSEKLETETNQLREGRSSHATRRK